MRLHNTSNFSFSKPSGLVIHLWCDIISQFYWNDHWYDFSHLFTHDKWFKNFNFKLLISLEDITMPKSSFAIPFQLIFTDFYKFSLKIFFHSNYPHHKTLFWWGYCFRFRFLSDKNWLKYWTDFYQNRTELSPISILEIIERIFQFVKVKV